MIVLLLLVEALAIVVACFLAAALLKSRPALRPAVWTAIGCVAILVLGSTILYAALSRGGGNEPTAAKSHAAATPGVASPQSMVARLASHLRTHPADLSGWLMLGRSYLVLREYPQAVRAYRHAVRLSGGSNVEALLGEAQARMLTRPDAINGQAGELIERALALAPSDPRALYLGAVVALHRGNTDLARARFKKLLTLNLPADFRSAVEKQMASLGRLPLSAHGAPATAGTGARGGGSAASIVVRVRLAPSLAARVPRSAPLYVFVSDPTQPGPPLAVKRLTSRFPQTVVLTAADSMVPGHSFTAGEHVEIVARVAPSGQPLDASGDLSGRATFDVGRTGTVRILIDHVTP